MEQMHNRRGENWRAPRRRRLRGIPCLSVQITAAHQTSFRERLQPTEIGFSTSEPFTYTTGIQMKCSHKFAYVRISSRSAGNFAPLEGGCCGASKKPPVRRRDCGGAAPAACPAGAAKWEALTLAPSPSPGGDGAPPSKPVSSQFQPARRRVLRLTRRRYAPIVAPRGEGLTVNST